jgi:hypothetical protein
VQALKLHLGNGVRHFQRRHRRRSQFFWSRGENSCVCSAIGLPGPSLPCPESYVPIPRRRRLRARRLRKGDSTSRGASEAHASCKVLGRSILPEPIEAVGASVPRSNG